jgi:hypothetical protein
MPLVPANHFSYGSSQYESNSLTPLPYGSLPPHEKMYNHNNNSSTPIRSNDSFSSTSPLDPQTLPRGSQDNTFLSLPRYTKWADDYPNEKPSAPLHDPNPKWFHDDLYHVPPPTHGLPYKPRNSFESGYSTMRSPNVMYPYPHHYGYPYNGYRKRVEPVYLSHEDKLLADRYPVTFVIVHSIIVILLSLTAIALQIVMIVYQTPYYFVGAGIWVGVYFLISAFLELLISKLN